MDTYRAKDAKGRTVAVLLANDENIIWAFCQGAKLECMSVEKVEPLPGAHFVVVTQAKLVNPIDFHRRTDLILVVDK